jgi:hypothetical protein
VDRTIAASMGEAKMGHRGPQRRCARCRFWRYTPDVLAPTPTRHPNEKMGLCEEPSRATERLIFGAGGLCNLYVEKEDRL